MLLLLVLTLGGALLQSQLLQGWFPHDEGALGQSAERILRGQMPHRDFDEIYTGLLSYIHAATFTVLPISSVSMRMPLFVAAMGWLWAMYRIAIRYAPPLGAALVVLGAFVWSVPNYPAPMPSWYILFCATFSALALIRWHESGDRQWLLLAGALGGIAFLFKLSGAFILFGGTLALLAEGATLPSRTETDAGARRHASFETVVPIVIAVIVIALAAVAGRGGGSSFLRFVLPTLLVAGAIALRIRLSTPDAMSGRWAALLRGLVPFIAGGLLPIAIFLTFYAIEGGLPAFVEGVFVAPFKRLSFAYMTPPPIIALVFVWPVALFFWLPTAGGQRTGLPIVAALLATVIVWHSGSSALTYTVGWLTVWGLLFIVAIDVPLQLLRRAPDAVVTWRHSGVVTLECLAVALALIEYPYAAPIYTLYALPLALLGLVASMRVGGTASRSMQLVLIGFLLAFGLLRVNPGSVDSLATGFERSGETARLALPRSGLRMRGVDAGLYGALIPFVQARAAGRTIWAGPDAPEVYFLSGLPNETRTLFAFLDEAGALTDNMGEWLDSRGVAVVVQNMQPDFSPRLTPAMLDDIRRYYPEARQFQTFIVAWR